MYKKVIGLILVEYNMEIFTHYTKVMAFPGAKHFRSRIDIFNKITEQL